MLLSSSLLRRQAGIAHGFTTRAGGVSEGPLASLNLARRPGERDPRLVENWTRATGALDPALAAGQLALLSQVHGREVIEITEPRGPLKVHGEADALVTSRPSVVLAVRTADCVPVLLAAPGGVAAVHSGWRGTAACVVEHTLERLLALTGCAPEQVVAAIGPHISQAAYEVGEEVVEGLEAADLNPSYFLRRSPSGTAHVDLGGAIAAQLARRGVTAVDRLKLCTATDERFYSHRTQGPTTGRQAALIARLP